RTAASRGPWRGGRARRRESTSKQLQPPQVVQVDHAFEPAARVTDEERGDVALFHRLEGGGGQLAAADGARFPGHALAGSAPEDGAVVRLQEPAQIAVGDAAYQAAVAVHYGGDAERLLRHLVDCIAHRRCLHHPRQGIARMHELIDLEEALAELAGGME